MTLALTSDFHHTTRVDAQHSLLLPERETFQLNQAENPSPVTNAPCPSKHRRSCLKSRGTSSAFWTVKSCCDWRLQGLLLACLADRERSSL